MWPGLRGSELQKRQRVRAGLAIGALQDASRDMGTCLTPPGFGVRLPSAALLRRSAFSLIEILITVGLLSFIILGLLLMFNQVQKAFRAGLHQADVLEAGRATTDLVARELESMTPSQLRPINTNFPPVNFETSITNFFSPAPYYYDRPYYDFRDSLQYLPGMTPSGTAGPYRTNYIQQVFFMTKSNQTYTGIGYRVVPTYTNNQQNPCIGALYRYEYSTNRYWAANLAADFYNAPLWRLHRIADGVMHLRVLPFDTNGAPITFNSPVAPLPRNVERNPDVDDQISYRFVSNAVPAYVELEIGFLEPHLVDRYKALEESDAFATLMDTPHARAYFSNRVANCHIFRKRIAVRSVDFAAYQ